MTGKSIPDLLKWKNHIMRSVLDLFNNAPGFNQNVFGNIITLAAWARDFHLNWLQALRELGAITAVGLPMAYAAACVWGAPVLYALYRFGRLRAATVIVVGAIGGTIVALWLAWEQRGSYFRIPMPLPAGAVLGALVGGACWWAGQGKATQH